MNERRDAATGSRYRRATAAGLFAAALLASIGGCTHLVRPSPNPFYSPPSKHNLNAGICVSPAMKYAYYDYQQGLFDKWRIEYGDALVAGSGIAFGGMFEKTTWLDSVQQAAARGVDLVIYPEITGFYITAGMAASCNVTCKVLGLSGEVLYDKSMPGTGNSGMLGVMLIGSLAYEPALRKTSEEAITNALLFQVNQMEQEIDFGAIGGR